MKTPAPRELLVHLLSVRCDLMTLERQIALFIGPLLPTLTLRDLERGGLISTRLSNALERARIGDDVTLAKLQKKKSEFFAGRTMQYGKETRKELEDLFAAAGLGK